MAVITANSSQIDVYQVQELLVQPRALDSALSTSRCDGYGAQIFQPIHGKNHLLAREGSYWVNQNPTISTGVKLTGDTATAWVATTPALLIVNIDSTRILYIDYIKLIVTVAGAGVSTPFYQSAAILDTVNRYSSAGTEVSANTVTPFTGVPNVTGAFRIWYGATATAATAARQIGRSMVRGATPVVNDQYVFSFGGGESISSNGTDGTTNVTQKGFNYAPAVLAPGSSFLFYLWSVGMSTCPTTEYEIAGWLK